MTAGEDPRRRAGDALAYAAADLTRVWRAGRAAARTAMFPGLLDGVAEPFLTRAGQALSDGRDPALVWPSIEGLIRVDARDRRRTQAELDAEWDLLEEVLRAACRALGTEDTLFDWISRALVISRTGCRNLPDGAPRGVVTVRLLSSLAATRPPRARAPR